MSGKVFVGGLPTDPEVRALRDQWPDSELAEGVVISYEDIEAVIGCKRRSNRFKTITTRWRKLLENNTGKVIFKAEPSGYKVLSDAEKVDLSSSKMDSAKRHARRAYVITARVDVSALSEDERGRMLSVQQRAAAITLAAQVRSQVTLPQVGE